MGRLNIRFMFDCVMLPRDLLSRYDSPSSPAVVVLRAVFFRFVSLCARRGSNYANIRYRV